MEIEGHIRDEWRYATLGAWFLMQERCTEHISHKICALMKALKIDSNFSRIFNFCCGNDILGERNKVLYVDNNAFSLHFPTRCRLYKCTSSMMSSCNGANVPRHILKFLGSAISAFFSVVHFANKPTVDSSRAVFSCSHSFHTEIFLVSRELLRRSIVLSSQLCIPLWLSPDANPYVLGTLPHKCPARWMPSSTALLGLSHFTATIWQRCGPDSFRGVVILCAYIDVFLTPQVSPPIYVHNKCAMH